MVLLVLKQLAVVHQDTRRQRHKLLCHLMLCMQEPGSPNKLPKQLLTAAIQRSYACKTAAHNDC
jgi:hypothetical protein